MSRSERPLWIATGLTLWVLLGATAGWALSVWWEAIGERLRRE